METLTPEDVQAVKDALTLVKQTAQQQSTDLWTMLGGFATALVTVVLTFIKLHYASKSKIKDAYQLQIDALNTRVSDKDAEIKRLASLSEALRLAAEQHRREQLDEAKTTATALVTAVRNSTDATNAQAKATRQTAEAIQSMHRDLVADLKERARGRGGRE